MTRTVNAGDYDGTEDAAVLVRRLLEILADAYWMAQMGDDPDAQALRSMLNELRDQYKLGERFLDTQPNGGFVGDAKERLDRIGQPLEQVRLELKERGHEPKERPNTTQILETKDPQQALYWSFESNVAHLGVIGRQLQRTAAELGVDSEEWRQREVLEMALAITAEIVGRSLKLIGVSESAQEEFRNAAWSLSVFERLAAEGE